MRAQLHVGAFVACLIALPMVATASPPKVPSPVGDVNKLASWTRTFIGYYEKNFPKIAIDDSLCNGNVPASRDADARALLGKVNSALTITRSSFGRVTAGDKAVPFVAERLAWRAYAQGCVESLLAQRKAESENKAAQAEALKARHFAFMRATGKQSATIRSLIGHVDGKTGGVQYTPDPAQLQKYKSDLETIDALCIGEFKNMKNDSRYANTGVDNPELICRTGAKGPEIIKSMAIAYARTSVDRLVKGLTEQADSLESNNGHITINGAAQQEAMFAPNKVKKEIGAKLGPVLSVAGLQQPAKLWGPYDAAVTNLWKRIKETGPTWKAPKKDGKDSSAEAAAKRSYAAKGTKVIKAYVTRNRWNIIKNGIGIALRRTKPGYIIYRVASDKALAGRLCRGRSFTYTEQYNGRRYVKAKTVVEPGYLRFEACK